jgi:hypothetical protein
VLLLVFTATNISEYLQLYSLRKRTYNIHALFITQVYFDFKFCSFTLEATALRACTWLLKDFLYSVSSLLLKRIFLVYAHQLLTLSAESLLYPKQKVIVCTNHVNLEVYLILVPFSINLCIFISYLLITVLIFVGLIIISILEVKQIRAQTPHSVIPTFFKKKSRTLQNVCLRDAQFSRCTLPSNGVTRLSSLFVTCHDEKCVVTCMQDTQRCCVAIAWSWNKQVTDTAHALYPPVSVMASFDGDVYRKETKRHSSCVT